MIIIPLMPWMMKPPTPVKLRSSDSNAALSSTPPSSTQMPSPATANTIAMAWMTTSTAMMIARIRYAFLMMTPLGRTFPRPGCPVTAVLSRI